MNIKIKISRKPVEYDKAIRYLEKKVQTLTDVHIKSVDDKVSLKEKEIMTI